VCPSVENRRDPDVSGAREIGSNGLGRRDRAFYRQRHRIQNISRTQRLAIYSHPLWPVRTYIRVCNLDRAALIVRSDQLELDPPLANDRDAVSCANGLPAGVLLNSFRATSLAETLVMRASIEASSRTTFSRASGK
jgi:hypothetical protein